MQLIDPQIENYAINHSNYPSSLCDEIYQLTHTLEELPQMLIGPMEASVLGFFIRAIQAKRVLEVGTFTGYSALAMAEQLPLDGEVVTLDIEKKYTRAEYQAVFNRSVHFKKIKFIQGDAVQTMRELSGEFDLIFIDADKVNYKHYFKQGLELLSSKGIIAIDNVLWSGKVLRSEAELDPADQSTPALIELNKQIAARTDVYKSLLPIRDGILLVQKI